MPWEQADLLLCFSSTDRSASLTRDATSPVPAGCAQCPAQHTPATREQFWEGLSCFHSSTISSLWQAVRMKLWTDCSGDQMGKGPLQRCSKRSQRLTNLRTAGRELLHSGSPTHKFLHKESPISLSSRKIQPNPLSGLLHSEGSAQERSRYFIFVEDNRPQWWHWSSYTN